MQIIDGVCHIETAGGISPVRGDRIEFREADSNTKVSIPLSVVLHCHSVAKFECERAGRDWSEECERLTR